MIIYTLFFPEVAYSNDRVEPARVKSFLKPGKACNFLLREMVDAHGATPELAGVARACKAKALQEVVRYYNDYFGHNSVRLYQRDTDAKESNIFPDPYERIPDTNERLT